MHLRETATLVDLTLSDLKRSNVRVMSLKKEIGEREKIVDE
jgi:hypothetical protein